MRSTVFFFNMKSLDPLLKHLKPRINMVSKKRRTNLSKHLDTILKCGGHLPRFSDMSVAVPSPPSTIYINIKTYLLSERAKQVDIFKSHYLEARECTHSM